MNDVPGTPAVLDAVGGQPRLRATRLGPRPSRRSRGPLPALRGGDHVPGPVGRAQAAFPGGATTMFRRTSDLADPAEPRRPRIEIEYGSGISEPAVTLREHFTSP